MILFVVYLLFVYLFVYLLFVIAVAHDSYTGDYYWVIAGGQANIFVSDSRGMESILYNVRDEPFALEFDWVSRRLFWVEDGPVSSPN